jgi:hypothetical protein
LRGVVLWAILTIVVFAIVLRVVLAVVVLSWIVTLLHFLSFASKRDPGETPLMWRRVLVRVTLLLVLCGVDEGHVALRHPPPPVDGVSEEDREDDHETGDRDADTRSDAQSFPANDIVEANGEGQRPG